MMTREILLAADIEALWRLAWSLGIQHPEAMERGKLVTKIRDRMKRQRNRRER